MPSRQRGRGGGLTQALDREVYQVIRNIIDSREQFNGSEGKSSNSWLLNSAKIYDEIRRSNSSLNRKPKKLLEDSIDRVLSTIEQDNAESESDAMDGEVEDSKHEGLQPRLSSNGVNRSIVGQWSTAASRGTTASKSEQEAAANGDSGAVQMNKRKANGEVSSKRRKMASSSIDRSPPTHVRLADLGGVDHVVDQFKDLLIVPMTRPSAYMKSGLQPPRGVLIHGPPGCGKTMIANAVAAELEVSFISISAPSIVSGMSGESEKALRDHFDEAKKCAPCLMFIDEIDAITPKRDGAQREMEKRIVAQLLTCMDDLSIEATQGSPVIVLAATNRPDSLDPALRRAGRFDREINMTVPTEPMREQILRAITRKMSLGPDFDFSLLAQRTPGFVGADLSDLVSTAGAAAIKRTLSNMEAEAERDNPEMAVDNPDVSLAVSSFIRFCKYNKAHANDDDNPIFQTDFSDFLVSLPKIQPSSLREGFTTIPRTTFAEIGSLSTHIFELSRTIINPILYPSLHLDIGVAPSSGTLLWGPPGNGKTLLAKAVANSSHANFISVKGPELLNKYVGESERAVRQVFTRARSSVPVIIFFDELDAVVPRRDGTSSEASARVVNTMLTELDGIGGPRDGIYIIGATNRPDMVDPAMLRPGRLESLLFVGLPDAEGRVDILRKLCQRLKNFVFDDAMAQIARDCERFSGADLEALLRKAGFAAIARHTAAATTRATTTNEKGVPTKPATGSTPTVTLADFEAAKSEVGPSVSTDDMKRYDRLLKEWGRTTH